MNILFADCDFLEPAVVLRFGCLDPSYTCRTVDDQEEGEQHDGESIAQYDEQSDTGYAVDEPVDPGIGLAVDQPVVGEEGRRDEETVEEFDNNRIGECIVAQGESRKYVVAGGDEEEQCDRQDQSRRVEELRLETCPAVFFLPAPFVYRHQLEGDEDEEIEEGAVVRALQNELHTEQGTHDDAGVETGVVLRIADGQYIGYADDGRRNTDEPGGIVPL